LNDGGLRRATWVFLGYGFAASVIVFVAEWFRRALALPQIFETLLHGMLAVGLPVAMVLAWHYPRLGAGDVHGPGTQRPDERGQ
jgi:hypothetical protein